MISTLASRSTPEFDSSQRTEIMPRKAPKHGPMKLKRTATQTIHQPPALGTSWGGVRPSSHAVRPPALTAYRRIA